MANKSNSSEPRVPGWMWLLTGVLLGALITLLMRLSELQPAPAPKPVKLEPKTDKPDDPAVKFNFYKVLRDDNKVVVPKREPTQPKVEKNIEYLLQVASFRTAEDAEQTRAELMLLNLQARVEKANVGKDQTWHRVIVGPFQSRSKLAKARNTLLSNRFEALVLKRKKTSQ